MLLIFFGSPVPGLEKSQDIFSICSKKEGSCLYQETVRLQSSWDLAARMAEPLDKKKSDLNHTHTIHVWYIDYWPTFRININHM